MRDVLIREYTPIYPERPFAVRSVAMPGYWLDCVRLNGPRDAGLTVTDKLLLATHQADPYQASFVVNEATQPPTRFWVRPKSLQLHPPKPYVARSAASDHGPRPW